MNILVCGLINMETTLAVDSFPVHYNPVNYPFFGINSSVSGVGFNVAKALSVLGDQIAFCSVTGCDIYSSAVKKDLEEIGIDPGFIMELARNTPQSVIIYEKSGRRQIHVDLKNVQNIIYPTDIFEKALDDCCMVSACNINFSRPLLFMAKKRSKIIATDVHALSSLDDDYNGDYLRNADILFLSDELIPEPAPVWLRKIYEKFRNDIIVMGLGSEGSLMYLGGKNDLIHTPAFNIRPVVNTIGCGDALFSAFLHFYAKTDDPYKAIKLAGIFASYKAGVSGASSGFLTEKELLDLSDNI